MTRFIHRSGLWLLLAAVVLAAGLAIYARAQAQLELARKEQEQFQEAEQKLSQLEAQIREYKMATARLGWSPGQEWRREGAELRSRFSRQQLGLLQEMLAANYEGSGIFSVRSFSLKQTSSDGVPDGFQVDLAGENLWLFEEKQP